MAAQAQKRLKRSRLGVWLDGIQGLAAGLIACAIIVISGLGLSFCALGLKNYALEYVSANTSIKSPLSLIKNIFSAKDNIYVIPKYTNALALANINLDALPALDSNIFFDIVTAIPENVHIDDFTFVEDRVIIFGNSQEQDAIFEFIYTLKKSASFKEIKSQLDDSANPYQFNIECVFSSK